MPQQPRRAVFLSGYALLLVAWWCWTGHVLAPASLQPNQKSKFESAPTAALASTGTHQATATAATGQLHRTPEAAAAIVSEARKLEESSPAAHELSDRSAHGAAQQPPSRADPAPRRLQLERNNQTAPGLLLDAGEHGQIRLILRPEWSQLSAEFTTSVAALAASGATPHSTVRAPSIMDQTRRLAPGPSLYAAPSSLAHAGASPTLLARCIGSSPPS